MDSIIMIKIRPTTKHAKDLIQIGDKIKIQTYTTKILRGKEDTLVIIELDSCITSVGEEFSGRVAECTRPKS